MQKIIVKLLKHGVIIFILSLAITYQDYVSHDRKDFWYSYYGSLLLAQCIYCIVLYAVNLIRKRSSTLQRNFAIASMIVVAFSFWSFYYGPRYTTEADGINSIRYECYWYRGYENQPLCVAKYMPYAVSNYRDIVFNTNDQSQTYGFWLLQLPFAYVLFLEYFKRKSLP